ncbi:MAG: hypothetical protein V1861_03225 [Candidatus Micrarchaeota archaeon]
MKRFFVMLCLLGIILSGCTMPKPQANDTTSAIKSFDDCVSAGYPVLESYPRQCKTPDGRTFVSQKDRFEIDTNLSCVSDADCLLVNSELGFSCCWAGACEPIDYSQDKWIAINRAWYEAGRASYCPVEKDCGPAPGCAVQSINENYMANCSANKCTKLPNITNLHELKLRCCDECRASFSRSPVGVGPGGAMCGQFTTAQPLSGECGDFFGRYPMSAAECGVTSVPELPNDTVNLTPGVCNDLQRNGDMEDKLNVILLPSHHYSNMTKFAYDAAGFREALFEFPFYEENRAKINIFFMAETSPSDGCELAGNTTPWCNITAMRSLASDCGYDQERGDQLVVLFDDSVVSAPYARGEDADNILFIGSDAKGIFVHEFSHSFGDLGDTYDGSWNNTIDPPYPNCASDTPGFTCSDKWGDLIGTGSGDQLVGCYQNCHAENWYRPTLAGDVMRDSSKKFYDPVALKHIEQLMAEYH